VLELRQKLPALEELRKLFAAGDAVRLGPNLRAASKRSATAGERRSVVSEQLTQSGRPASKGRKGAKPPSDSTTRKRRPA